MYRVFLASSLFMLSSMHEAQEEWKERLRKEWRDSMKLPRKKKKLARKGILAEWRIASFSVF